MEIEHNCAGIIQNSKGENNQSKIPRVTIKAGERALAGEYRGVPDDQGHQQQQPQ